MLDLSENLEVENMKKVQFSIDKSDRTSFIKSLRTGSEPEMIAIVVDQSEETDTVFQWDLKGNAEFEAFDVGKNYEIIWDSKGVPVVVAENKCILTNERCAVKVFDV